MPKTRASKKPKPLVNVARNECLRKEHLRRSSALAAVPKLTPIQAKIQILGFTQLKLSERILQAVADCKKMFAAGWREDMECWNNSNNCACCMAGACMIQQAGSLKIRYLPREFYELNNVRLGSFPIHDSCTSFQKTVVTKACNLIKSRFKYKGSIQRAPWTTYVKAAKMLAAAGL